MKKILLLTIALAFASAPTFAQGVSITTGGGQPASNVEVRAKESTDKMNNLVNLTKDQYNQVLQVNRSFFSQAHSRGNGIPAAKLSTAREQQLKGILTPDQWQVYQNARNNNAF